MLASFSPGSSVSRRRVLVRFARCGPPRAGVHVQQTVKISLATEVHLSDLIDGASVKEGLQLRFEADFFSSIHRQMYWQMHARTATAVAPNH